MVDFSCQIKNLLLNMLKISKIPGFSDYCSKFQFFFFKFLKFKVFPSCLALIVKTHVFPGFQVFWQPCIKKKINLITSSNLCIL